MRSDCIRRALQWIGPKRSRFGNESLFRKRQRTRPGFLIRIKRICWITAWGVWLWLGFGLYRELPRDLGRVVCKLPTANLSTTFIGDKHEIYTHESRGK